VGRFVIDAELGSGGQAVTWRAHDATTGQEVALKQLAVRGSDGWKPIELFEREARVLRALEHPAIPRFIDAFEHTTSGGEVLLFLAQELVSGSSLAQQLRAGRRFDEATLVALAREILAVLAWLHGLTPPVVHRDLKPSNLLLRDDGRVALIDFGAAQERPVAGPAGGSTVVGTHGYMAPEQLMGRASPASDLFGLGTTLVHLASGHAPAELPTVGLRLAFRDVLSLDDALVDWLERLCAPDPTDRPESAEAALAELDAALATARKSPTAAPRATLPPRVGDTPPVDSAPPKPPRALVRGAAVLALAALAAGVVAIRSSGADSPAPPTASASSAAALPASASPSRAPAPRTSVFVDVPWSIEARREIAIRPRLGRLRKAESGFPMSSLDLVAELENRGAAPVRALQGLLKLRALSAETRVLWQLVASSDPPLEPGETRVVRITFHDVPSTTDEVRGSVTRDETGESTAAPPPPRRLAVAGLERLPAGVTLALDERRPGAPEVDPLGGKAWFDVSLRIAGIRALDWLTLVPACVDPAGATTPRLNDRDFQVPLDVLGTPTGEEGDVRVFRVVCPPETSHVAWRVGEVKASR
jgi:serine/threonine protein kinase